MSNAAKKADAAYTVLDTHRVPDARREALTFSACLAADKGYSSRIVRVTGGWDVVASDNRAIRFLSRAKTLWPARPEVPPRTLPRAGAFGV